MSQPRDESAPPPSGSTAAGPSTGAVLHRLRSPVTAIIGFADTLTRSIDRGTATPEVLRDRLARIRSAAEHIDALLDDLRTTLESQARAAGPPHPPPSPR